MPEAPRPAAAPIGPLLARRLGWLAAGISAVMLACCAGLAPAAPAPVLAATAALLVTLIHLFRTAPPLGGVLVVSASQAPAWCPDGGAPAVPLVDCRVVPWAVLARSGPGGPRRVFWRDALPADDWRRLVVHARWSRPAGEGRRVALPRLPSDPRAMGQG